MAAGKRSNRKWLKGRRRQAQHLKYIGPTTKPCKKGDFKERQVRSLGKRNETKEKNQKGVYIYRRVLIVIICTVSLYVCGTGTLKYLWCSEEPIFHYCLVSLTDSRPKRFVSCVNQLNSSMSYYPSQYIPGSTCSPLLAFNPLQQDVTIKPTFEPAHTSYRWIECCFGDVHLDNIIGTANEPIIKFSECSEPEALIVTQPSDAADPQGAKSYETGAGEQEILLVWTQHQKEHANGINDAVFTRLLDMYMSCDAEFPLESAFSASTPIIDNTAECEEVTLCTDEADVVESSKGLQDFEYNGENRKQLALPTEGIAPRTTPTGGSNGKANGNDQQPQTTIKQACRQHVCHGQATESGGNVGGSGDGEDPGKDGAKPKRIGGCEGDATEVKEEAKKHDNKKRHMMEDSDAQKREEDEGDNSCRPPHVTESENFVRAQTLCNALDCCVCGERSEGENHVYVVLPFEKVVCSRACAEKNSGRMATVHMREMRQNMEHLRKLVESHAEDAVISAALKKISGSLDCPICRERATSPMTICDRGHATCADCSFRLLESRCPICRKNLTDFVCLPEKFLNALNLQRATNEQLLQWYWQVLHLDSRNPIVDNIVEVIERNSEAREPPVSGPPSDNGDGDTLYIPPVPHLDVDDNDLEICDFLAAGSGANELFPREPPNQQLSNFFYARHSRSLNDNQVLNPEPRPRDPVGAMLNEQPRAAVAITDSNTEEDLETDGGLDADEDEEELLTFRESEEKSSKDDTG